MPCHTPPLGLKALTAQFIAIVSTNCIAAGDLNECVCEETEYVEHEFEDRLQICIRTEAACSSWTQTQRPCLLRHCARVWIIRYPQLRMNLWPYIIWSWFANIVMVCLNWRIQARNFITLICTNFAPCIVFSQVQAAPEDCIEGPAGGRCHGRKGRSCQEWGARLGYHEVERRKRDQASSVKHQKQLSKTDTLSKFNVKVKSHRQANRFKFVYQWAASNASSTAVVAHRSLC